MRGWLGITKSIRARLCSGSLALSLFGGLVPQSLSGQTVRPVVVEAVGHDSAKGRFELVNESLVPMNTIIEVKGFRIDLNGNVTFQQLDPSIHVRLSTTSLRIPAKQSRYVFYEAKADRLPAWFVINSTFVGARAKNGLSIEIGLPHSVYLLPKEPLDRGDVRVKQAKFLPSARRVAVDLENVGSRLGRVLEWQGQANGVKRVYAGFPLLPNSHRHLEVDWDAGEDPSRVMLRFQKFTVDEVLTRGAK